MLLDLPNLEENIPKMIVADIDIAMMNVVATVCPKIIVLFCRFMLLEMI
jgi:hypothetical protein